MPSPARAPCSATTSLIAIAALLLYFIAALQLSEAANNFAEDFSVSWASSNVRYLDGGQSLQLILEKETGGAGFVSKKSYLFGSLDMQIKLVPGDSAGTVTAYYLSSDPNTADHDEIDFEFLGNVSGEPYILQTNVFVNGIGGREQRIYLWFDPTTDFHTYTVKWTKERIIQLVDGVPIRVFSAAASAAGFPDHRPMRLYSSLWNGDSWATRGGLVKIDWTHAPFVASYRGFSADACAADAADRTAIAACQTSAGAAGNNINGAGGSGSIFDPAKLEWVKRNYMVYNYCTDKGRYAEPPAECVRQ